ncbi:MAG: AzlD domain-containing protein [Methylobacteriaceae bacterium]|nr:AzlD domain-containing protein [Methylobacteriaceae bacterium]MBV9246658.1 AzlD domain-containing protein [Methylobacteriaceae bacterium]
MSLDPVALTAILAMAAVTYATRIAGIFLAGRLALRGRAASAFEAIPPSVLVAVIAPTVLATGKAETTAAFVTALAATRLPLLGTVVVGVLSVVILRAWLG